MKCDELKELKTIKDKYESIKIDNNSSDILNNQIAEYKEKLVVIEKKIIDFEYNKNNNAGLYTQFPKVIANYDPYSKTTDNSNKELTV